MSFRSLLQGFQAATGTPINTTNSSSSNGNSVVLSQDEKKPKDTKSAIFEWTSQVWNQTLIRQATRRRRLREEHQLKATVGATGSVASNDLLYQAKEPTQPKIHLAVCICIVDTLPHENIWRRWMQERTSTATASVYVHAKQPEIIRERGSSWLQECLIPISHRPNWNDVRIIRAMLSLIEFALDQPSHEEQKDEDNDDPSAQSPVTHLLFATESCIPIAPIQALEQVLTSRKTGQPTVQSTTSLCSFLKYYGKDEASRFEERHCWDVVNQYLPIDCIQKALPGWCLLTAQHAREVLRLSYPHRPKSPALADLTLPPLPLPEIDLTNAFEECWAPEEVYFATALCLLGHIDPINGDDVDHDPQLTVRNQSVVHAEWPPRRHERERAHPKTWDEEFSPQLVARLRQQQTCNQWDKRGRRREHFNSDRSQQLSSSHVLFLRKVKHQMPIERWEEAVLKVIPPHRSVTGATASSSLLTRQSTSSDGYWSQHSRSRYDSDPQSKGYSRHDQRKRSYSSSSSGNKRMRQSDEGHYAPRHSDDGSRRHSFQRNRRNYDNR